MLTEIFFNIFIVIILIPTAVVLGKKFLQLIRFSDTYLITTSLGYLIGFSMVVYGGVILGLFGQFTANLVIGLFFATVIWLHRSIFQEIILFFQKIKKLFLIWQESKLTSGLIFISGLIIIANFLATQALPVDRDVIAYHLPEASLLVSSHSLSFPHGGQLFYGNLPLFMEVAYALGTLISGYSLAQLFHYLIFLSFIVFVFGWLKKHYSIITASTGILGLLLLNKFVEISTTALVDTAFAALEIIGLLLALDWWQTKRTNVLTASGAILGIALSIKYSPLFTVAIITFCIMLATPRQWRPKLKAIFHFGWPILLFGGFWYIKNILLYGNPTYPLLFGHIGYGEVEYDSLIQAIQNFVVPRNVINFLFIPWTFYLKPWMQSDYPLLSLLYNAQPLIVILGLLTLPFLLMLHSRRKFHIILLGYCFVFTINWFISTHQERFLDTVNALTIILASISLTQSSKRWKIVLFSLLFSFLLIIGARFNLRGYIMHVATIYPQLVLQANKVNMVLGRVSKEEYISQHFDCGYAALTYLEENDPTVKVLDNWSIWHNSHFKFYDNRGRFLNFPADITQEQMTAFIVENNIAYIYFNTSSKADFAQQTDLIQKNYFDERVSAEQLLLDKSELIFEYQTCQLYQITR